MTDYGVNLNNSQLQARFAQMESTVQKMKDSYQNPVDADHKKLKKTAQEFEAVFFKQIIEQMDKTVERGSFLSGGAGEEMFRSMLFDEVATRSSNRPGGSGLGLAELIYSQMEKNLSEVKTQELPDPSGLKIGKPEANEGNGK
jgi:Rod binding domain-containing protein